MAAGAASARKLVKADRRLVRAKRAAGFEPTYTSFADLCLSLLATHAKSFRWGKPAARVELAPLPYRGSALVPSELRGRVRSFEVGEAAGGTRTRSFEFGRLALSPLSFGRAAGSGRRCRSRTRMSAAFVARGFSVKLTARLGKFGAPSEIRTRVSAMATPRLRPGWTNDAQFDRGGQN